MVGLRALGRAEVGDVAVALVGAALAEVGNNKPSSIADAAIAAPDFTGPLAVARFRRHTISPIHANAASGPANRQKPRIASVGPITALYMGPYPCAHTPLSQSLTCLLRQSSGS